MRGRREFGEVNEGLTQHTIEGLSFGIVEFDFDGGRRVDIQGDVLLVVPPLAGSVPVDIVEVVNSLVGAYLEGEEEWSVGEGVEEKPDFFEGNFSHIIL